MPVIEDQFIGVKDPVMRRSFLHLMRELIKLADTTNKTDLDLQEQINSINLTLIDLQTQIDVNLAILNTIINGETLPIITHGGQEKVAVRDDVMMQLLTESLTEMKKINMQLAVMNDLYMKSSDITT